MQSKDIRHRIIPLISLVALILMGHASPARGLDLGDFSGIGAAFLTHIVIHETGHYVVAQMGGAQDVDMNFFTMKNGNFYLGLSTAKGLDSKTVLSYKLAGEVAANFTFETALKQHRSRPTTFNRALLFFSGTDFLFYSVYAFYLAENRNSSYDPVGIADQTGLSDETILGMAALQTALNAWRVYSGQDRIVPYLSLTDEWAEIGIRFTP